MISNPDAIQEHEAAVMAQKKEHAGRAFGVRADRVHHIGRSSDRGTIRHFCHHGSSLVSLLHEDDPPYPIARRESIVELKPKLEQVDNLFFTKMTVLAGQCAECGMVYIADFREK